jgi:hypothetical protein
MKVSKTRTRHFLECGGHAAVASLGSDVECGGHAAAFERVRRFIPEKPAQAMLAPIPIRPLLAWLE